jgi:hypothetical protein
MINGTHPYGDSSHSHTDRPSTATANGDLVTRRIRTTLLAATAATTLLLTAACGGSDDSGEEIEGVDEGGNEQQQDQDESQEPEPTEENGIDRPDIALPNGFENVYEDWESDNPTEQAVLDDAQQAQNAVDLAILERNPDADYLGFYHAGDALSATVGWVEGFIRNDRSIAGTVRYLNPEVTLSEEHSASLTYCGDESEATAVDVESGEDIPDESDEPQVSYTTHLQLDESGVWVTRAVVSEREECAS